jgi:hypothetical protein
MTLAGVVLFDQLGKLVADPDAPLAMIPLPGLKGGVKGSPRVAARFPRDFATKNTKNMSAKYVSERDARNMARTKIGRDPVQVEPHKLRSQDGRWQYRGKPDDLAGHGGGDSPHVHLERLNPETGEVLENWHLRW